MMWENQRLYAAAGYSEYTRTRPAPDHELIHYRKHVAGWDFSGATYLPTAAGVALAGVR